MDDLHALSATRVKVDDVNSARRVPIGVGAQKGLEARISFREDIDVSSSRRQKSTQLPRWRPRKT